VGGRIARDIATVDGPGIDDFLSTTLERDTVVGVRLGPPRANRKPVLEILERSGEPVAFAKIGVSALTDRLIRNETQAIARLSVMNLRALRIPTLLVEGEWGDSALLVQSVLPVHGVRATESSGPVTAAQLEVARIGDLPVTALDGSAYLTDLAKRVEALNEVGQEVAAQLDRLVTARGDQEMLFGAWHGDWRPTNAAVLRDELVIWDWERFAECVPRGFDALHMALFAEIYGAAVPAAVARSLINRAASILAPFDVPGDGADTIAALYLLELSTRYLEDGQAQAGARLGSVRSWALPVLAERVW
jgi:hypothetical protein